MAPEPALAREQVARPEAARAAGRRRTATLVRRAVFAAVVLAATIAIALALRPAPLDVETTRAARGRLVVTIDEDAETRVRERFVVSAPVAGRVSRIVLEPGDPVVANTTVLAEFTPSAPALLDVRTRAELSARVEEAQAGLARVKAEAGRLEAELRQAERVLARSERLAKAGAIAAERLEADQLAVRSLGDAHAAALAEARAAEWAVAGARASLTPASAAGRAQPIALRAPADGVVLKRYHESEAIVAPGTPLLEVGDVSRLEVVAEFLSTDAVTMAPGQPALVEGWGGAAALHARVARVEPSGFTKVSALGVEEQRVNVIVEVVDPPPAWRRIGDRYRLTVRVVTVDEPDVLKVPTSSLVRQDSTWSVFVVEEGRATRRVVDVGPRNDREAAILGGLPAGAEVIDYPGEAIADGTAVTPKS
jgi:HlyD family secretion protein